MSMDEKLTPEQRRAKIIAELPRPLKPIPPEIMAEILENQLPYEEALQEYKELMEQGGYSIEPYLEELKQKYAGKR
jgi:hypothetical protein